MNKTIVTEREKTEKAPSPSRANALASKHRLISHRHVHGKELRQHVPRSSHADWSAPADRDDPIAILVASSARRVKHLVPIRYGRMLQSPFAFYRGAAAIMAADLARTPITGLKVQLCGDCHLMNFGVFATPERHLIFDVNDFDETLPGPWEWDLKRLTASFMIAGRHNQFKRGQARGAALACACSYREQMARYSQMPALEIWYERIDVDELLDHLPEKSFREQAQADIRKAAHGGTEHDFPKLVELEKDQPKIRDNPPLVYHPRHAEAREFIEDLQQAFHRYRKTLPDERRVLIDRYTLTDHAVKVVGVGSVGTRCGILLLMAGPEDPLFLQVKEANSSVLEPYLGKSEYDSHGERVVIGQRLMQAASDLFLGWTYGRGGRHFYIRQLHDVKVKPMVEVYDPPTMNVYAQYCGWVLARAHARSGNPKTISEYLGASDRFDQSIADFAESYADQNEKDYREFVRAVRKRRLLAVVE
ncbi:MAG TPA: DUF2252 domain-containing protein [Pirellulales bacterium]|nr:DUF2252 domain-containing protein [Pirellulales bacterium]